MLILCLALQALVYRSGLYYRVADPKSNTGAVVNALLILEQHYQPGARTVLVLGDFRIVEGFSGPLAQGDGRLRFIALGVPGSSPRTWYYLLREIVRRGYAFEGVVLGITLQARTESLSDSPLSLPRELRPESCPSAGATRAAVPRSRVAARLGGAAAIADSPLAEDRAASPRTRCSTRLSWQGSNDAGAALLGDRRSERLANGQ